MASFSPTVIGGLGSHYRRLGILIVINPSTSSDPFEIEYTRLVRQHSKFTAIGTGEEYALGAMKASYTLYEEPEAIAHSGVRTASRFDKKTSPPFFTHSLELLTSAKQ